MRQTLGCFICLCREDRPSLPRVEKRLHRLKWCEEERAWREEKRTFTRTDNKEQSRWNETSSLTALVLVRRSKQPDVRIYKKRTEDQERCGREEQRRISSIIQSHLSNDSQIERPRIIFKTNKLLKDEVPSLLANHLEFFKALSLWDDCQSATISGDQKLLSSGQSLRRLSQLGKLN